jgi:cytochrome c biogenesis protein CcdA
MGFQVTLLSTLSLIAGNRDLDKALFTLLVYAVGFGEAFLVVGVFGQGIVRLFKHIKPQNLGLINQVAGRLTVALILIVNDGDVLKAMATWKTGPSLTRFLK